MGDYTTVRHASEFELELKKSRFIGYANPVENESEVKAFLNHIKSLHPQARHHVYAWRVGGFSGVQMLQRYSDDGEPSGTGGLAVLKKMAAENLTQLALVVVRYFGGVLLGTGGLSRAYASSAEGAIKAAKPMLMRQLDVYDCVLPYHLYDLCKNKIQEQGMQVYGEQYAEAVYCNLACKSSETEQLMNLLQELGSGSLQAQYNESKYIADLGAQISENE